MAFPSRTFPFKPKLKCLPTYAPCLNGLIPNSTSLFCLHYFSSPMSGQCFFQMPAIYREPLCPLKVLPLTVSCLCTTSESVTSPSSLIQAHAPDQNPLTASDLTLPVSLCRLLQVPAGKWPFPTLSLQSLRRCLDPYPAVSSKCSCSCRIRSDTTSRGR